MLVAIVGKRNAGKSTLVNAVAKLYDDQDADRVIVSEVPGTTRDSVDVRFEKDGKTLVVIDTAGVRKKRHMVTNDVEFYSFHRAQRSIRRADVVFMLIDGAEHLSEPDKKLAQYIAEQFKPVVLVVNKWDRVLAGARAQAEERGMEMSSDLLMNEFEQYLNQELPHLDYAPVAFITAKDSRNVQAVLDTAQHLFNQSNERVGTGRLNAAIKRILEERFPSSKSGRRPRIYYATQVGVAPPTIVLFVNDPAYFDEAYQRFMTNRFRELLPYAEVPIRLQIRGKNEQQQQREQQRTKTKAIDEQVDERPARRPPAPRPTVRAKPKPQRTKVQRSRKQARKR
jgi:GTP-binding protein